MSATNEQTKAGSYSLLSVGSHTCIRSSYGYCFPLPPPTHTPTHTLLRPPMAVFLLVYRLWWDFFCVGVGGRFWNVHATQVKCSNFFFFLRSVQFFLSETVNKERAGRKTRPILRASSPTGSLCISRVDGVVLSFQAVAAESNQLAAVCLELISTQNPRCLIVFHCDNCLTCSPQELATWPDLFIQHFNGARLLRTSPDVSFVVDWAQSTN